MKVVLVRFKDGQRREFPMDAETLVIGRGPKSGLRIPTRDVSRRHCELVIESDKLIVHDVGSTNGTRVNGQEIEEVALKAGDRLAVGPVTFVVQIDGQPAEIEPPEPSLGAPPVETVRPAEDESEDTGDLLDLDDLELELDDEDPISAVEAILDDEEEDENLP